MVYIRLVYPWSGLQCMNKGHSLCSFTNTYNTYNIKTSFVLLAFVRVCVCACVRACVRVCVCVCVCYTVPA